jgi:nicotinate-nucleotide adenylyltransferase
MNIGLYFGSFNPIHTGHLIVASFFIQNNCFDKVWFVVSPHNPFKTQDSLLNEYQRLHLVKLAIEGEEKFFRASNIEFELPRPSYTSDTLAYLREKFPGDKFSVIMGSDSFQNVHKWKNVSSIIGNHQIFVYCRPGFEPVNSVAPNAHISRAPLIEISSTQIRSLIAEKKSIRYLVPDAVKEEIDKAGYYKLKRKPESNEEAGNKTS